MLTVPALLQPTSGVLTLPALLQPTSGLDARAAAIVMRTVRNTVNTGRTVVCTIHQPSIDIFEARPDLQWQACARTCLFLPGHPLLYWRTAALQHSELQSVSLALTHACTT